MAPTGVVRKPAAGGVNFGDMAFYAGGFNIPPGAYAINHEVVIYQPTKQDGTAVGSPFLGVKLFCYPLNGGEVVEKVLSMGSKAHEGFMPNETGKGLAQIPNGSGSPSRLSNWGLYLQSYYDCGLPKGIFTNDLSVLDGVQVVISNIPEPEERKGYGAAKTGDVEEQKKDFGPKMVPVCTEIKEDGKPWEGTGGFPEQATTPAPKVAPKAPVAAPKVAPKVTPKAAPAVEELDENALETAAVTAAAEILEIPANANGMLKVKFRTEFFKKVQAAVGDQAQTVIDTYAKDDATLGGFLEALGYGIAGVKVVPKSE